MAQSVSSSSSTETAAPWWREVARDRRDFWRTFGPAIAVAAAGFVVAWMCMDPAPPRELTIAAGNREGAYYRVCRQYAQSLAEHGITLHVRETQGSVENYRLLQNDPEIDIAIVQGGTAPDDGGELETIACLYPEPLWIFCRGDETLTDLRQLQGRRVAIGPAGSGTHRMVCEVLAANGLAPADQSLQPDARTGHEAVVALQNGELDAACFVTTMKAEYVAELIRDPDVQLLSLQRQRAYAQLYPWLQPVTLAQGVVDLQADLPSQDVQMIAPSANLVASSDLHEAFIPLFLQAAHRVHAGGGVFVRPGEFPNAQLAEHRLNRSADEYFRHGPSFLERYLPFWVASLISRTRILVVPLLTLLIPLVRLTPPIYRWRIRSRIYRWYEVLRRIDQGLSAPDTERSMLRYQSELRQMDEELREINVPLSYMEEFYNLRLHLELVSRKVHEHRRKRAA